MASIAARAVTLIRDWPARALAIDLRSLAAFRVGVAALLLVDLAHRLPWMAAFYSDRGVLPRSTLAGAEARWRISLHAASGQLSFEWLLLTLAGIAALALLAGWRTRAATLVSAVLYASLLNRAPLLAGGGERLLALLLFWACWLPLGARWSVDHARGDDNDIAATWHWATAGLRLQVALLAFGVTVLAPQMNPLAAALAQPALVAGPGAALIAHPWLLRVLASAVTLIGLLAPWLLFAPGQRPWLRRGALLALALLPLGALLLFHAGLAPWAALVALLPFADAGLWRRQPVTGAPLRLFHDAERPGSAARHRLLCEFLILPDAQVLPAQGQPRTATLLRANDSWVVIDHDDRAYLRWDAAVILLRRSPLFAPLGALLSALPLRVPGDAAYRLLHRLPPRAPAATSDGATHTLISRLPSRLAAAAVILMLAGGAAQIAIPSAAVNQLLAPPLRLLRLDAPWRRLQPVATGTLVVAARYADGSQSDLLRPGMALDFRAALHETPHGDLWRRYLDHARAHHDDAALARYANWQCRHHAGPHGALRSLQIIDLLARDGDAEQRVLWREDCAHPQDAVPGDG